MRTFSIIALGEGVFFLIRRRPTGQDLTAYLRKGVLGLQMYFFLAWTYFHGNTLRRHVHALYHRWWIKLLQLTLVFQPLQRMHAVSYFTLLTIERLHTPIFATLIMLSSGILYPTEFKEERNDDAVTGEQDPERLLARTASTPEPRSEFYSLGVATITITICIGVAVVLVNQLMIGMLNKSMDVRRELLVGNNTVACCQE